MGCMLVNSCIKRRSDNGDAFVDICTLLWGQFIKVP